MEWEPEPKSVGLIKTFGASGIQADAAGGWKTSAAMHAKASGTEGEDSMRRKAVVEGDGASQGEINPEGREVAETMRPQASLGEIDPGLLPQVKEAKHRLDEPIDSLEITVRSI